MQHECRITVLETKVFDDYQEKYLANPKSGPCPCFKKGDTFLLKSPPNEMISITCSTESFVPKHEMPSVGTSTPHCRADQLCISGQTMNAS